MFIGGCSGNPRGPFQPVSAPFYGSLAMSLLPRDGTRGHERLTPKTAGVSYIDSLS